MGLQDFFSNYTNWAGKDSLTVLREYLGQEPKQDGRNYRFQCPFCADSGEDNLTYNSDKDILKCFADDQHSKDLLKKMASDNKSNYKKDNNTYSNNRYYKGNYRGYNNNTLNFEPIKDSPFKVEPIELEIAEAYENILRKNALEWHEHLLSTDYLHKNITSRRGFSYELIKATKLIGYNPKEQVYTFCKVAYSTVTGSNIINFEFRQNDLSSNGVRVLPDMPTCLCQITTYKEGKTDTLLVVEGFLDGFAMIEHLKLKKKPISKYHIVTPSNGVSMLPKQLRQVNWGKYKNFYLCIDNDKPADKVFNEIQRTFVIDEKPIFRDLRVKCENCTNQCELYKVKESADWECEKATFYDKIVNKDSSTYIELEKEFMSKKHPCKTCDIQGCGYGNWYCNRCKDMNDYLRRAEQITPPD